MFSQQKTIFLHPSPSTALLSGIPKTIQELKIKWQNKQQQQQNEIHV